MTKTLQQIEIKLPPILKWAGGKTELLPLLLERMPKEYETYHEPFFGGGALFFALCPRKAIIADYVEEVVNFYRVLQSDPSGLYHEVVILKISRRDYEEIRAWDRDPNFRKEKTLAQRAARFYYINKLGYRGLYRVNSKNECNVPWGAYTTKSIADAATFHQASKALEGVEIAGKDFGRGWSRIKEGDFVYLDPPYLQSFDGYSSKGFDEHDHSRLVGFCDLLTKKGVKFMLSNSVAAAPLFSEYNTEFVDGKANINQGKGDTDQKEIIVRNYQD